jgi:serine/threonine protein kinase
MALSAHGNALPEGYRLLWYRIGRVLGQGGFGITYEAFDTNLEKPVAIKEYLPTEFAVREADTTVRPFTEDRKQMFDWGLDRFLQEARTLAKFHHPNIVLVHNVFEKNGTAYMAMQYEQGEALSQLFKLARLETEADLLRIALPLLDGLEHMHDSGFIHRDIKPPNIYVRTDGSPVLLDFGSARFAVGGETRTLTSLVSPGYAPYEQYHSETARQGPWTDIYGLAATLYAGINHGRGPVDAIVRGNARIEGKPDPMKPALEIGSERYSEAFLRAIDAALGFTPEERPQSVAEWRKLFPSSEMHQPVAKTGTRSQQDIATVVNEDLKVTLQPGKPGVVMWTLAGLVLVVVIVGAFYLFKSEQFIPSVPEPQQTSEVDQQRIIQQAVERALEAEAERKQQQEQNRLAKQAEVKKAQQAQEQALATTGEGNERLRQQQIDDLLTKADKALAASRLTSPADDNATKYLKEVLRLDSENLRASQGIGQVINRYLNLAEDASRQGEWNKAKFYLNKADSIEPGTESVDLARQILLQQQAEAEKKRHQLAEIERKRLEQEQKRIQATKLQAEQKALPDDRLPITLVLFGETKRGAVDFVSDKLMRTFKKVLIEMSIDHEIEIADSLVDKAYFSKTQYQEKSMAICRKKPVSMLFGIIFDHWKGGPTGEFIMTGYDCTTNQYTKKSYNVVYDQSISKWGPSWKKAITSFIQDTDIFNNARKTYTAN